MVRKRSLNRKRTVIVKDGALFGSRNAPPLLFEEFKDGPGPALLNRGKDPSTSMSFIERRYLYWAHAEGIKISIVAQLLGYRRESLWGRLARLKADTGELMKSGFVARIDVGPDGGQVRYFCRYCGGAYKTPGRALDHGFLHVFPDGANVVPVSTA